VTHHPPSLSWIEAAAIWMQYITAYGALIDIAKLTKGDTILIPAASSSVGLAAIQIAKKIGAVSIALTRGQSKRQALLDAGAAHVIASDEQDLVKEVLRITGDKGARVVFDPVGGPTFNKLAQATAHLGILFLYGGLADGSFKPLIAKTFPLDKIVDAHRFLESNQQVGKVVVTV
jgi:NADPH:quinone reductase-like Zn-dependent oxidoreductase